MLEMPDMVTLYERCPRFDEGMLYQTPEYARLCNQMANRVESLRALLGPEQDSMIEDLLRLCQEETELEAKHFFQCGISTALCFVGKQWDGSGMGFHLP